MKLGSQSNSHSAHENYAQVEVTAPDRPIQWVIWRIRRLRCQDDFPVAGMLEMDSSYDILRSGSGIVEELNCALHNLAVTRFEDSPTHDVNSRLISNKH